MAAGIGAEDRQRWHARGRGRSDEFAIRNVVQLYEVGEQVTAVTTSSST